MLRSTLQTLALLLSPTLFILSSSAVAQVVQLPIVRDFSITGGALIPDSGTGYLGGNNYRSAGSVTRGPLLNNRAMGAITGGSHASASVQIIDLQALDQAILNSATPTTGLSNQSTRTAAVSDQAAADKARQFLSAHSTYREKQAQDGSPNYRNYQTSLATTSDSTKVDATLAEANVRHYLRLGQEAEAAHRIQSARVYYRLAIESMTPELMERYKLVVAEKAKAEAAEKKSRPARRQF